MRVQKLSYSSIFIKNNNNLYSRIFFLPLYHRAVQCICSQRQNRGKNRHQLFGLHLLFLFVCYLNTKLCHPLPIFIIRMELCLQRSHCMTTDLCSSFETDTVWPLPSRPRPAQAHKCLKNTRLSAGASVKTVLSTHLTKPGSRKEKQREKPYSLSSNSLKTHGRHKEKTTEMSEGPRSSLSCFLTSCSCSV